MDFLSIAKDIIINKLSQNDISEDAISSGITDLFSNEDNEFDVSQIITNITQNGGLGDIVSSWLGDGENISISPDTISSIFENEKISNFASTLNIDEDEATNLLSNSLPDIIDNISSGGSILDSIGGLDGALSFAKKFF